jgi:hypothetical protein
VQEVATGSVAGTVLKRAKNGDKLSVRHDFYPVKQQSSYNLVAHWGFDDPHMQVR